MHTIRLRGPWQIRRDPSALQGDAETVTLPVAISDLRIETDTPLLLERRFQRPSGLAPTQNVLVVVDTPLELLEVTLNDVTLDPNQTRRFPVRHLLAEHNVLSIKLRGDPANLENAASASALDVCIEIDD